MPLYSLEEFKVLIKTAGWQFFNKRRALAEQEKINWSDEQVAVFMLALSDKDFKKTVPQNKVNDLMGIEFLDADQYVVRWCEENMTRADHQNKETFEIFIKIAIVEIAGGKFAGAVSFHLS